MMVSAKLKKETQVKLWSEAVNCSSFMENIILKMYWNDPAMEYWTGNSVRTWFNLLVPFRRIGYVAKKDNIKGKMIQWGFPTIMVEYAVNPATETYRMYNPATKRVILTHDMKWHVFDGENAANDPTLFDFDECTG